MTGVPRRGWTCEDGDAGRRSWEEGAETGVKECQGAHSSLEERRIVLGKTLGRKWPGRSGSEETGDETLRSREEEQSLRQVALGAQAG